MVIQTQICDDHTIPGLRCIFPQTIIDAEKGSSHVFSEVFPSIVKKEHVIVVRCTLMHPVWIIGYVFTADHGSQSFFKMPKRLF